MLMKRPKWIMYRQLTIGLSLCLLLSGCAGMRGHTDTVRVSLAGLRIQDVKGFETAFDVTLRIFNRGEHPLSVKGIACQLELDGKHLAEGVAQISREIAPYSSDTVTLMVYSSMLDMIRAVQGILRRNREADADTQWQYAVKGHLDLTATGLLDGRVPFQSKGMINLEALTGRPKP